MARANTICDANTLWPARMRNMRYANPLIKDQLKLTSHSDGSVLQV